LKTPDIPPDEDARLAELRSLNVLDTIAEERFDRLTRMARRLFGVDVALVSLVDENRQWFKSCAGMELSETPRDISFCGHAILGDGAFVIPDALQDERFRDNPLVAGPPHVRFYAGCPLRGPGGRKLGTLCIIDSKPRAFSDEDVEMLVDLALMVEREFSAIEWATVDELTGLSNRRGFMMLAQHSLQLCTRQNIPAALVFIDLDHQLEQVLKTSIRQFFEAEGEARFRDIEAQVLAEVTARPGGMVLSTGGGAVLRPENRQVLRDFGNVLYLRASPEEIFKRVKHDRTRPLLQVNNPLQKLRELYAQRDALYREAATYVIETGRPTVQTLVNMIMMQLEMAGLLPGLPRST